MKGATLAPVLAQWKAQGVEAAVLDGAPGHRSAELVAAAPPLVPLPAYSPEMDPAERYPMHDLHRESTARVVAGRLAS